MQGFGKRLARKQMWLGMRSNCCFAVFEEESDVCSNCKEHANPVEED